VPARLVIKGTNSRSRLRLARRWVAGDDGGPALYRAERHVNVDDVIVIGARAQQAHAARDVRT
jgi:hypothetical protein